MEQITFSNETIGFDSLPAIKTVYYPWAIDGFKPYSYARLVYVKEKGLAVDFLAFERDPVVTSNVMDGSAIAVSFNFNPQFEQKVLVVVLNSKGENEVYLSNKGDQSEKKLLDMVLCECYAGDDEQGWYFGTRFMIREQLIKEHFNVVVDRGDVIKGNVYKFQKSGSKRHFGSAAEIGDNFIFTTEGLLDFLLL